MIDLNVVSNTCGCGEDCPCGGGGCCWLKNESLWHLVRAGRCREHLLVVTFLSVSIERYLETKKRKI